MKKLDISGKSETMTLTFSHLKETYFQMGTLSIRTKQTKEKPCHL
jgi:hypothetical protein